ncbi:MAG TPA: DUF2279 domain-containing protein [Nitrospirae bacterium]|nr:hypothetical protein BMS3Abin10_00822 [bacterium BMS3Abin10]GBE38364.1 hypothetical protein BMS3Bbin08_00969 [bacterium BMS3Bbin08]HDH50829.1 DUF2279 domain-containing protein [Nitrospirota bacterium]HDK16697.1 DUF2279 domain-containing protein [Nitrospirota bacterium]HDK81687.1 DUF2279 domain-containing protein [Nitrospirota bacterium]
MRVGFLKKTIAASVVIFLTTVLSAERSFAFSPFENFTKEQKLITLNAAVATGTFLWGVAFWNYGKYSPHGKTELWFDEEAYRGGADKTGHFYATYAATHLLSYVYESWGYETAEAAKWGAISTFTLQGLMELGDAISKYGFSYEDMIMNTVGSTMGYLTYRYPKLANKIDFRLEYFPSEGLIKKEKIDFTTDYDGMKFLVAVKLDGFDFVKNKYLKYLELQLGYYTRGYKWETGPVSDRSRNIYVAVGLNISKIANDLSFKKTSRFLNYYQIPYTYLPLEHDFNDD